LIFSCTTQAEREKGKEMLNFIKAGDFRSAEALLMDGAFVDAKDDLLEASALMWACMNDSKEMAQALLDHDADINLKDKSGRTALQY
jgi:ankyrin repeat protein